MNYSLLWICSAFCVTFAAYPRKIFSEINPDCGEMCEKCEVFDQGCTNLVYTRSVGLKDTIHHLWSTIDNPSFLVLQTDSSLDNSSLEFHWTREEDNVVFPHIICKEKILYSFALVFNRIFEYNDPEDLGSMGDSMENVTKSDFQNFCWQNVSTSYQMSDDTVTATFKANLSSFENPINEGIFSLQLETQGGDGRSDVIPRLLFTSNTSQVRVVMDSFLPKFDSSRFAIEMTTFSSENEKSLEDEDTFKLNTIKSLDDEYTPGVFKLLHLVSKGSAENGFGSFLSWKPVAYTTNELSVTDSTSTIYYTASRTNIPDSNQSSVAETFIKIQYGYLEGIVFNTSFGNTQDGFYSATKYTQWSFTYGLGVPGEDKFSTLVITVLASGLGLPLLLIILSTAYLIWHKLNIKKDDLLLSRN